MLEGLLDGDDGTVDARAVPAGGGEEHAAVLRRRAGGGDRCGRRGHAPSLGERPHPAPRGRSRPRHRHSTSAYADGDAAFADGDARVVGSGGAGGVRGQGETTAERVGAGRW
ncbi:hypothetical protein GCM10025864_01890 [Luteimicrobium album]|uniref:Uncharacterized protein n=1 Tax=Luteimicrobium album TaxID=1054550 RepID=A0ABQ6HVQ4_9MICO|nr:hypothetical protein GCM10025864_01890 [Luteimicrobium album]